MSNIRRQKVQYLEEMGFFISTKTREYDLQKKKPPKIKGKHFSNLEYLADADLVWLTPDDSKSFPSCLYDPSLELSYFEQCFQNPEKLGEGSFGSVLKVLSKDDNKLYAMKVSKEPFRNNYDRKWKLLEVEHHKQLTGHPCIVSLYQAWEEDRYTYMMMELCKHNLDQNQAMPEELCWHVLTDITLALDHIHKLGLGHFDVKLENILYGYDGRFKLSDFGLVYDLRKAGEKPSREGDAKYVAPELLASWENFTEKADIFSLGISILELAGNLVLPTYGPVWKALRENIFPLAQTQNLSDELFFLLVRMMSPNASLRPSAEEILNSPTAKAMAQKWQVNTGLRVRGFVYHYWFSTIQLYLMVSAAIRAVVELFMATKSNSATAITGRQPPHPVVTSTPYSESSKLNNSTSISANTSSALFQQVSAPSTSYWSSPSFRRSPLPLLHNSVNLRRSTSSIAPNGITPVRLSQELKAEIKARRAMRNQRTQQVKRNLFKENEDEEKEEEKDEEKDKEKGEEKGEEKDEQKEEVKEEESTPRLPKPFVVENRQRRMKPRNLKLSFEDDENNN